MIKNQFAVFSTAGLLLLCNLLISCFGPDVPPAACLSTFLEGKKFNVTHNTGQVYNGTTPVNDVSIGTIHFVDREKYTSTVPIWGTEGTYSVENYQSDCQRGATIRLYQGGRQTYAYGTYLEQQTGANGEFWIRNKIDSKDTLRLGTISN